MPRINAPAHPVARLTDYELRDYRAELERVIPELPINDATRQLLQGRLNEVITEQEAHARSQRLPASTWDDNGHCRRLVATAAALAAVTSAAIVTEDRDLTERMAPCLAPKVPSGPKFPRSSFARSYPRWQVARSTGGSKPDSLARR